MGVKSKPYLCLLSMILTLTKLLIYHMHATIFVVYRLIQEKNSVEQKLQYQL